MNSNSTNSINSAHQTLHTSLKLNLQHIILKSKLKV